MNVHFSIFYYVKNSTTSGIEIRAPLRIAWKKNLLLITVITTTIYRQYATTHAYRRYAAEVIIQPYCRSRYRRRRCILDYENRFVILCCCRVLGRRFRRVRRIKKRTCGRGGFHADPCRVPGIRDHAMFRGVPHGLVGRPHVRNVNIEYTRMYVRNIINIRSGVRVCVFTCT